jgi:hypothetical protein
MPIANEISAGFFVPRCRNTAMLPIMVIENANRAEMSSTRAGEGPRAGLSRKSLESRLLWFGPYATPWNLTKRPKESLEKAWTKLARIWKCLEKKLGASALIHINAPRKRG